MAASKSMLSCFLFLLLLTLLLTHNLTSGCRWRAGQRCTPAKPAVFRALQSRKMLQAMKKEMEEEEVDGGKRRPPVEWDQLRRVPSGPDPLHHNGGSPKKPRTP